MFVGHYAVAFAGKRAAPRASLGWLFAAAGLLDLLWPIFLLLGWESVRIDPGNTAVTPLDFTSYPYSHSLVTSVGWGVAFAAVYWTRSRDRTTAMWMGILVVSHWVLDWLSHRPDLPLWPGSSARAGLGLWYSIPWTMAVELGMFALGVWIYARSTVARDRTGRWALWFTVGLFVAIYIANIFGPPPPNARFLAWFGLLGWIPVLLGAWIDRHRMVSVQP